MHPLIRADISEMKRWTISSVIIRKCSDRHQQQERIYLVNLCISGKDSDVLCSREALILNLWIRL